MKIILIFVLFFASEYVKGQIIYTKEEYDAYYNWRYEYSNNQIFKNPQATMNEMEIIISDYRIIQEHNQKFEAGLVPYCLKLWKKSSLDEVARDKLKGGFNLIDIQKVLSPQSGTLGTTVVGGTTTNTTNTTTTSPIFQKNPLLALFNGLPPSFPVAPPSLDWRDYDVVQPVQDQGYECSSCWAFSAAAAIEGVYSIATGKSLKLSEQQLIDCNYNAITGNWGCDVSNFQ